MNLSTALLTLVWIYYQKNPTDPPLWCDYRYLEISTGLPCPVLDPDAGENCYYTFVCQEENPFQSRPPRGRLR